VSQREERIGQNEALFREVNERTKEIVDEMSPDDPPPALSVLCECGLIDCSARLSISPADYERVRGRAEWFILMRGHEMPDVEFVVEDHSDYLVVEKREEAAEVARETDPRA
jgi:hypothetical protein